MSQETTSSQSKRKATCCPHCKGTDLLRKSHKNCPYYTPRGTSAQAASSAATGSGGAGTVEGLNSWELVDIPDEYELKFDYEVKSEVFAKRVESYVNEVLERLKSIGSSRGHQNWRNIGREEVFDIIAHQAIAALKMWCDKRLIAAGHETLDEKEMLGFLSVTIWKECILPSLDVALLNIHGSLNIEGRCSGEDTVINRHRYIQILDALSCCPPQREGVLAWEIDNVSKYEEFEKMMYLQSRRLFGTEHLTFVIDDELVSSRSKQMQSETLNARKAGKEGLKNNAIADAFFRSFLAVRHERRIGHNDHAAVKEILRDLQQDKDTLNGQLATVDRGYSKKELWTLLAGLCVKFVMIADTSDHPFMSVTMAEKKVKQMQKKKKKTIEESTSSEGNSSNDLQSKGKFVREPAADEDIKKQAVEEGIVKSTRFVVDDDPRMGRELFAAKGEVRAGDGRMVPVTAVAFVDYQGKKESTRVLRFVECMTNVSSELVYTICMEKKDMERHVKPRETILFFPCSVKDCNNVFTCAHRAQKRKAAEEKLLVSSTPLTCGQRCADWFVLGLFVITGTVGGFIARKSADARKFLARVGEEETEEAHVVDLSQEDSSEDGSEDEDSDEDTTQGSEEDLDGVDFNEGSETEKVANLLCNSWVSSKGLATQAMKSGTINEANIFCALARQNWCIHIFDVGLLQSRTHPYLGVSPDAIALVRRPGAHGNASEYVCCEFKTRSSQRLIGIASDVSEKYGKYFGCVVGDSTWWEAVPWSHRGQVIHQAVVSGFECVFTISKDDSIIYSCFVELPPDVRATYLASLERFAGLMTWAHDAVQMNGRPPSVPLEFGPDGQKVLASHFRLWRAVAKRVSNSGPLPPIKSFKSMAQVLYNTIKGGIDGSTQFVEAISASAASTLTLNQRIAFRGLRHLIVNSFLAYRLLVIARKPSSGGRLSVAKLDSFRNELNKVESLQTFTARLALDLGAASLRRNKRAVECIEESSDENVPLNFAKRPRMEDIRELLLKMPKQRQAIVEYFRREPLLHELRLGAVHGFTSYPKREYKNTQSGEIGKKAKQKYCVLCGTLTTKKCSTCDVPLHCDKRPNKTKSCHEQWHTMENLQLTIPTKR